MGLTRKIIKFSGAFIIARIIYEIPNAIELSGRMWAWF